MISPTANSEQPRIALAANRDIGVRALRLMLAQGIDPVALLTPETEQNTAAQQMMRLVPELPHLRGSEFRSEAGIRLLRDLNLDYLLSVHFPLLFPDSVLHIPRIGTLNLHPALLPYNRGWHTPSWAILDGTPYGATLHWVDGGVDTGDLALQKPVAVRACDTADTLYARVLDEEIEVLRQALPLLYSNRLPRIPQQAGGTQHRKAELTSVRHLNLDEHTSVREVLRRIRALTTNREDEAAWFESDGTRYIVQVRISQAEAKHTCSSEPASSDCGKLHDVPAIDV